MIRVELEKIVHLKKLHLVKILYPDQNLILVIRQLRTCCERVRGMFVCRSGHGVPGRLDSEPAEPAEPEDDQPASAR